jgi:8-oxo-dGTP diphosphatase
MSDTAHYCLGFAFIGGNVVLIHKEHGPEVVVGRLNGIGGKERPYEAPIAAMVREFEEETGHHVDAVRWRRFLTFRGEGFRVVCYAAQLESEEMYSIGSPEAEQTVVLPLADLPGANVVPNLRWLVPMALDETVDPKSRVWIS